jgi:hypothetical protein
MTQRDDVLSDADLDALFAEAQSDVTVPSPDFMARVLADAAAVQDESGAGLPVWAQAPSPTPPQKRRSWIASVLDGVGGWRGGAGLATATVMGLAIGLGAPNTVSELAAGTWTSAALGGTVDAGTDISSYALDDLVPSFFDLAAEG